MGSARRGSRQVMAAMSAGLLLLMPVPGGAAPAASGAPTWTSTSTPARTIGVVSTRVGMAAPAAAPTATRRARARVSARYWPTSAGGTIVQVSSNAAKVRIKYRNATGRARTTTVRLTEGTRRIVLPRGARKIRAVARPTTTLRASKTRKAKRGDTRFSLVVVPDTQMETGYRPSLFSDRMRWIAANRAEEDIRFVIHVGDLVNTDNCGDESLVYLEGGRRPQCNEALRAAKVFYPWPGRTDHHEFRIASTGLSRLEAAGIPYSVAIGNHDTSAVCGGPDCIGTNPDWAVPAGTRTEDLLRTTGTWNSFLGPSRFRGGTTTGYFEPGRTDTMYQTFSAGGMDWMVLTIELWPRPEAVAWASAVVADHPHHNVLVNTHQFLSPDGTLSQSNGGYGDTSPQYLFDQLVGRHPNVVMAFSGHIPGARTAALTGTNGNRILAFLTCFHDVRNAQTRLIEINTARGTLRTEVRYEADDPGRLVAGASGTVRDLVWTLPAG